MKKVFFLLITIAISLELKAQVSSQLESNDKIREELGSMFAIERKIELLSNAIYKTENQMYLLKSDIDVIQSYVLSQEKELRSNNDTLSSSLKELIKVKNKGAAQSLFSGESLQVSATSNEISKRVYDNVLIDTERKMLRLKSLETEKKRVAKKLIEVGEKSKRHAAERKSLLVLQTKKKKKLQSLFKDNKATKRTINEFNKAYNIRLSEANIENLKNDLKSSFFTSEGKVVHPTKNKLIRSYGFWRHPRYGYKRIFKGNTYRQDDNEKVFAVGPGIIKYAGPIVGDKTVMIVDHGGKYYSVYKGLTKPLYKVGSKVKRGAVIARAQKKSELYFEIRHYSDPINLNRWMVARK